MFQAEGPRRPCSLTVLAETCRGFRLCTREANIFCVWIWIQRCLKDQRIALWLGFRFENQSLLPSCDSNIKVNKSLKHQILGLFSRGLQFSCPFLPFILFFLLMSVYTVALHLLRGSGEICQWSSLIFRLKDLLLSNYTHWQGINCPNPKGWFSSTVLVAIILFSFTLDLPEIDSTC